MVKYGPRLTLWGMEWPGVNSFDPATATATGLPNGMSYPYLVDSIHLVLCLFGKVKRLILNQLTSLDMVIGSR